MILIAKDLLRQFMEKKTLVKKLYLNGLIPLTLLKPAYLQKSSSPATTSPTTPPPGSSIKPSISDPTSKSASFQDRLHENYCQL